METIIISSSHELKQQDNTAFLIRGRQKMPLPVERLRHLVLLGQSRLNSKFLTFCGKHGIRVSVFDYYGYFKGSFEPVDKNPCGRVQFEQALVFRDDQSYFAQRTVSAAIHNMISNLKYYAYRGNTDLSSICDELRRIQEQVNVEREIPSLMGYEGQARQTYYQSWKIIDRRIALEKRVRRPPDTPVNCLISFLNGMVYGTVRHELSKTHLNASFGYLHAPGNGRFSLTGRNVSMKMRHGRFQIRESF